MEIVHSIHEAFEFCFKYHFVLNKRIEMEMRRTTVYAYLNIIAAIFSCIQIILEYFSKYYIIYCPFCLKYQK